VEAPATLLYWKLRSSPAVVLHPPYVKVIGVVVEEAVALSPLLMQVTENFVLHPLERSFTPSLRTEETEFVTIT